MLPPNRAIFGSNKQGPTSKPAYFFKNWFRMTKIKKIIKKI